MDKTIKTLQEMVKELKAEIAVLEEEIGTIAGGGYVPAGSVYFANLPALSESRYGFVYNIKDDFVTTSDFVEGAGKAYSAGTNVGIIKNEMQQLKYDVFSAFVNTGDIYDKIDARQTITLSKQIAGSTTVEGALEALDNGGGGGGGVTVDDEMSIVSTNPVQNKVITAALNGKLDSDGKAASATSADFATKATNDGQNNNIANTYLTKTDAASTYLGVNGKAVDATKADSATSATNDANGNNIANTYETKSDASNKTIESLADVNVSNVSNGQILKYDATNEEWVNGDESGGSGLPSGGTTGQSLVKHSNTDGDVEWATVQNIPNGGTTGQALVKHSNTDKDVEWATISGSGAVDSVNGKTGAVVLSASDVGAVATTSIGSASGVAGLDSNGKVPSAQLPSYVDDVEEYNSVSNFPLTGETGKIYVAKDTNKTYRWSGSEYVEISESLALGETSSTAYAGNKGKANADAIAAIKDGTNIDSFGDVETALADKISKSQTPGLVKNDGTIDTTAYVSDISGKADKVSGGTSGNFASLDANGNLTDSGHKHSDYLTSHQDITGKADKVSSATNGNFAGLDSNGNLTDSGKKASDFAAQSDLPDIATTLAAGLVKPDGTTITITQDGTISSVGGGDEGELLTGTLLAASWNNKSQTVSVAGLNSSDIGVVGVLDTATSVQLAAAEGVTPVSVSNGTITFTCEDVPTVDIPFGIVVTGTSSNGNLPDGGTTGQVLKKKSNTDLDVEWATLPDTSKMYSTDDTAFTDIADGDYIPVYDTSATTKKKSLWSNIKSVLKTYFDTLYQNKLAYSTTEQVIGTWIDSKPLYQKTINFGTLPNNTSKSVAHSIANLKNITKIEAIAYGGSGSSRYWWSIPYAATSAITDQAMMYLDPTNINIVTKKDMTTSSAYITVQYTKTTD